MIVRWGLGELPGVLDQVGIKRPLLVASPRWDSLHLPVAGRWSEIPSHRIEVPEGVDGILAVGGGSAIDTAKAASAASELPLVSVPTTYSGSEWTAFFGVRGPDRRMRGGGAGAKLAGIVYEPELTLDLPAGGDGRHRAERPRPRGRGAVPPGTNARVGPAGARKAAELIAGSLSAVLEDGGAVGPRTTLLRGAARAGEALGRSGLCLGHAMAQALGGRYGLAHGAMNALCLPPALRFNGPVAAEAIMRFGKAMGTDDPVGKVEQLAQLGGFERLRDFGVPENELDEVAEATAVRAGAKANPRPASPAEIAELLRSIY